MKRALAMGGFVCVLVGVADASDTFRLWTDDPADAVARRTDLGADGVFPAETVLPDLVSLRLSGWLPSNGPIDPYAGSEVRADEADLFRLDIVFEGLVNPPGPIDLSGFDHDPFRFGPSPVFGFFEFDADDDKDTGGELIGATQRYLANVARFGARPYGSTCDRSTSSPAQWDMDFYTYPYFERSGQDFQLNLCGCHPVSIISRAGGDGDDTFEAGETWVVESRFFQRAGGYQDASGVFGGSAGGLYDPITRLRFRHEAGADRTTVTLVFPLTMRGAAILTGEAEQSIDQLVDIAGSHSAVIEAIQDVIDGANGLNGPVNGPARVLVERWENKDADDDLDVTDWEVTALVGTAYLSHLEDALYVWTDVGFDEGVGDFDCNSIIDANDCALLAGYIDANDGGPGDLDGLIDGIVTLPGFAENFSVYDLDGDGLVGPEDVGALCGVSCPADWNGDGVVNAADVGAYLSTYFQDLLNGTTDADYDGNGVTNPADVGAYLSDYFPDLNNPDCNA